MVGPKHMQIRTVLSGVYIYNKILQKKRSRIQEGVVGRTQKNWKGEEGLEMMQIKCTHT